MKTRESSFTGEKGFRIAYTVWEPDERPAQAILLLIHGYAEHVGRYQALAEYFTRRGYVIYAPEHRGHGHSDGVQALIDNIDWILRDLDQLCAIARKEQPALPAFVLGHSLGGLLATDFSLAHQDQLAGAVISAPAILLGKDASPLLLFIVPLLSFLLPQLPVQELPSSHLTHDAQINQAYDQDPLIYRGKVMARTANEMLRKATWTRAHLNELHLPLLCLHGGDDRVTDPNGTRLLFEQATCTDKRMEIFEGLYHEILNENKRPEIFAMIADWMDARITPAR